MRRSGGVTAWAILLIVAGFVSGLSVLAFLSAWPGTLDALERGIAQSEALPTRIGQGQLPERTDQMLEQFKRFTAELGEFVNSPTFRTVTFLRALLGAAALIAGIGLFFLSGWARRLALWQAGLSIPAVLMSLPVQRRLSEAMLRISEAASDPAGVERMRQTVRMGETIGQWSGIAAVLIWNGLIIWFFTRPSVRAQFTSARTDV